MDWQANKPDCLGEYIILVPAENKPSSLIAEIDTPCDCSVHKAWFDGNIFHIQDSSNTVEECLWLSLPKVFTNEGGIKWTLE